VLEGRSAIDTALVTGESLPQSVEKGAQLYAGTVNIEAALTIEVAHESDKSLLAEIVRLMENAQQSHAQYVRLADRAARLYTPFVHSLAVLAFVAWFGLWGASWQDALMIAVTVLIITCPCALGLAVPIVQVLASGLLMKRGLLLKSGDALERLARVDTLVFDKTGTLTIGKPMLQAGDYAAADLRLAASLALHSAHPLSKALVEAYKGDDLLPLDAVREVAGQGLEGFYDAQRVRIGQRGWCGYTGDAPDHYGAELCLAFGDQPPILFTFEDELRSDAVETVQALRQRGMQVILLSGDRMEAAAHIAGLLGIEDYYAAQKPDDKYAFVQALRAKGAHVLMVGDGLNDAAALAAADVSVAPGSAIDMTQKTADVVFMGDKLEPLLFLHKVARRSLGLVKTNFALAILYNIFAVPLAFAGHVTPMFAALAMSASSLLVIANSFRLKLIR
jgi:Cu2+-exporting ATPase